MSRYDTARTAAEHRTILAEAIEEAKAAQRRPGPSLPPMSLAAYDEACRLLGLPKGTLLTEAQINQAAEQGLAEMFVGEERI